MPSIITEHQQHIDSSGLPIVNGEIHIGARNTDPKLITNKITIYSDRDLGTPLANPQATDAYGKSVNKIYVPGRYSIAVLDSADTQKYIDLDAGELPQTGITQLTNIQGTNTIIADGVPAIDQLVNNQMYLFTTAGANTGAVTLQVDLTAAKAIKKLHDQALVSGDFEISQIVAVVYNETEDWFELTTPPQNLATTNLNVSDNLVVGLDIDATTGTIDTLDSTTFESPTITKSTVPVYGHVTLDTPELISLGALQTTATAVNVATLNTAGAKKAELSLYVAASNGTSITLDFASSTFTPGNAYTKAFASDVGTGDAATCINDFTVNLDVNNDFWYAASSATVLVVRLYLVGYYV